MSPLISRPEHIRNNRTRRATPLVIYINKILAFAALADLRFPEADLGGGVLGGL